MFVWMVVIIVGGHDGDKDGSSFTQEIPAGDEGFVYVLSGQGYFSSNGTLVKAGQSVTLLTLV